MQTHLSTETAVSLPFGRGIRAFGAALAIVVLSSCFQEDDPTADSSIEHKNAPAGQAGASAVKLDLDHVKMLESVVDHYKKSVGDGSVSTHGHFISKQAGISLQAARDGKIDSAELARRALGYYYGCCEESGTQANFACEVDSEKARTAWRELEGPISLVTSMIP